MQITSADSSGIFDQVRTEMKRPRNENVVQGRRSLPRSAIGLGIVVLGLPAALLIATNAGATAVAVPLATSTSFSVLAGSGVTNTGPTTISGDLGTYPTTTVTGANLLTINGTNHAGDGVTQLAKRDLVTAYDNAAGQGPTSPIAADLGGQTLAPGVYHSASSIGLTGTLTLNGGGDASSVFIFQAGSTLTTATSSQIVLTNGAQACNVFWQIGSSATLGTNSSFVGSVLALQSITVTTGVSISGRVLARNGAVTLDSDSITTQACAASTTPTTLATTSTSTGSTTTTTGSTTTTTRSTTTTIKSTGNAAPAGGGVTTTTTPSGFAKPPVTKAGFTG